MSDRELHERLITGGYRRVEDGEAGPPTYERADAHPALRVRHCTWDEGKDWYEVSGWTKDANLDMVTASIWDIRPEDLVSRLDHYEDRIRRMLQLALDTAEPRQGV